MNSTKTIAALLLLATGVLHVFGFALHEANPDTYNLIPVGIVYAAIGVFLLRGAKWAVWAGIIAPLIGGAGAFVMRSEFDMPLLMTWAFIVIDIAIIFLLGTVLLGNRKEG